VVGSVVANRDRAEFEALIGFMVNVVVLRTRLDGDPSFAELLQRVHGTVLDAHANHGVPFEALVDALRPPRDSSRSPLFQIAFDLRDPEITRSPLPGVSLGVMEADLGAVQYDLHLTLEEGHGDDDARQQAMAAGAVDVLYKPLDERVLLDAIERALGRSPAAS